MNPTNTAVMADTALFVALIDRQDDLHEPAMALAAIFEQRETPLLTTDGVLIEVANYFSRSVLRQEVIDWIAIVRGSRRWEVVPLDPSLVARGEQRYARFTDKNWSMTDCISMEVMLSRGIQRVATSDRGFIQAGFDALLTGA